MVHKFYSHGFPSLWSRFMEPALDVLWYKLDNLAPLLLCMPEDLTIEYDTTPVLERPEDDSPEQACTLFFRRSMLASDWESFEAVATRVRILDHCNWWDEVKYTIDPSVFRSLACAAQGRTGLLPQLQQLSWKTSNDEMYSYIFLFLSPTITNLTVSITTGNIKSDRMRFSLLATLVSKCPSVRSVKLCAERGGTVHSWRDLFSNHPSSACASFGLWASLDYPKLQNIDLSTVTDVLAGLPILTTLKLYNCKTIDPRSPSTVKGFPMLQYLDMCACSIEICLDVLTRMSCTPLVRLYCCTDASRETQWAELFSILPNGISRNTLAIVSFSSSIEDDNGIAVSFCFQTISPLLQFRRISEFSYNNSTNSISLYSALDLGDNDVTCIAKAWPCLKLFCIRPPRSTLVSSRLSLHALIPFAKYCPELETLSMTIKATVVDDCEEKPGEGLYDSRLQKLHVFDSPIDDPARVAAFILDAFPNLREISSISDIFGTKSLKQRWDEVERRILAAQEANRKK